MQKTTVERIKLQLHDHRGLLFIDRTIVPLVRDRNKQLFYL